MQSLAAVSEERLLKLWEGLGYYNRARNLQKAAVQICEQYQGKFPESYEEWLALPGIGAYTAGAVTSIAFGKKEAAVDGNVYPHLTPGCSGMIQRSAKQHFNGMYGKPSKRHCRRRQADSIRR